MHYIVDAYNLLFRILKKRGSLEKSRELLITELNDIASELKLQITLVFDGAEDTHIHPTRGHFDAIELIYTPKSKTADEYITSDVENAKTPGNITVVTNDRELAGRSKNHGTHTLSIDGFLSLLSKKKSRKKTARPVKTFRISQGELARLLTIFEKKLLENTNDE
jgi:predicted RNA-binding protein with PIN domain